MSKSTLGRIASLVLVASALPLTASAQVFGTFPWQMQPYCNVVTLTLTTTPAGFTLDGTDDQCGATNKASAVGVASFSATGNVTLNFSIVTAPAGKAVHVSAVVSPANGSGTWTDSVGNSGTFAFFGSVPGLPARPFPSSGLGASVITTTEIAAGAVGASDINTAEVQARVAGTCPAGQAITGVNANGTVTCGITTRMLTATGLGNNPDNTTAFPSSNFVNFIGPTVNVTLAAGEKAYMNVMKALGTTAASAIDLDIFPCARLSSAANTVAATAFTPGIFNLTTVSGTRIPMSISYVYTTAQLPVGQTFAVGMCARFSTISNQTNWNNNEFGAISVLVTSSQ